MKQDKVLDNVQCGPEEFPYIVDMYKREKEIKALQGVLRGHKCPYKLGQWCPQCSDIRQRLMQLKYVPDYSKPY